MARNDSMAGQPPISISQTTRNTAANTVFGQTAGELAPTSSNAADDRTDASQQDPAVILRGDSFTLLRGAEKRPFLTSPNSSPEPSSAPLESWWPESAFGSWRREFASYFFREARPEAKRPGLGLYIRTEDG